MLTLTLRCTLSKRQRGIFEFERARTARYPTENFEITHFPTISKRIVRNCVRNTHTQTHAQPAEHGASIEKHQHEEHVEHLG